jgi:leucyl/phenylalanyl-tRNA---protein transferase
MPDGPPPADLDPELLLRAYASGLFPMAESADDPEVFWVEPRVRGVLPLDRIIVSRSLAKTVRRDRFRVYVDRDFDAVIDGCAVAPGRATTWINATIRATYGLLFRRGFVHTVEVERDGALVGGLYGVALGAAFFGESMFHRETDASKVALVHLAARLLLGGYTLLDTQFVTPHLASLGTVEMPQRAYRKRLAVAVATPATFPGAARSLDGAEALAILQAAEASRGAGR